MAREKYNLKNCNTKSSFLYTAIIVISILPVLNGCQSITRSLVVNYVDPGHEKILESGIIEKQIQAGEVYFNYAEGPDNGPPLILLNAQHMDWFSYNQVLPDLSENFHIFAVDYQGHGNTTYPAGYPMTADRIGNDLGLFIKDVIGEPAFVTGNSSGGLLTVWLAANRPEFVKAVVLEDPPLFSSEYPRIKQTISYRSFTTCSIFIEDGDDDFLLYWLQSNAAFVANYAGDDALPKIIKAVEWYREDNPGEAVELRFLQGTVRNMFRGMNYYDPRFGAAFYDGSWNASFDHAEALTKIECPALLIHADFEILENGELNGAMDQNDADLVMSLLKKGSYVRINSGHVVHEEDPEEFISILEGFFLSEIN